MNPTAPQRFLSNDRNVLREAMVTASAVQSVSDQVLELPIARQGTAQAKLTGDFTGAAETTFDIEVLDNTVGTKNISTPIFSGAGSGIIGDIASTSTPQTFSVELGDAGIPINYAGVDFEGVAIRARQAGATGNDVRISIDHTSLVFTPSNFSLLVAVAAGTSQVEGPAFDWDTAVLGPDNIIPASAHRVAFGDDHSRVYLQYKQYIDGKWQYSFVPEIDSAVPKGAVVNFVTGGRTVTISDGGSPVETYAGIVTLYDFLNAVKEGSALVEVLGVVANDRGPTGQASHELLTRTDAHAEQSSGSGSNAATGFESVTVSPIAPTELITATCFAVNSGDNPLAHLGAERWNVKGSLSGNLGTAITNIPFSAPTFGFVIPQKLPTEFNTNKGKFDVTDISYTIRNDSEPEAPPICVVALTLGPSASDQTITLEYTARPTGNCLCDSLSVPDLNNACLGTIGAGGSMSYSDAVVARLVDLYDWQADTVRAQSSYTATGQLGTASQAPFIDANWAFKLAGVGGIYSPPTAEDTSAYQPAFVAAQESLLGLVGKFEQTVALIDALPPAVGSPDYRTAALAAWDSALAELKADVAAASSGQTITAPAFEALSAGNAVSILTDNTGARIVKKGIIQSPGTNANPIFGFVIANVLIGATATVYLWGIVTTSGLTAGAQYQGQTDGSWSFGSLYLSGRAITTTQIWIPPPVISSQSATYWGLLGDRYNTRLQWSLISGGISPLGKSDASVQESGDGCWQDWGDPAYWTVVGSDGAYAPAFSNHPYYSSRKASAQGKYYSTHEFAFQINVKCPQNLKTGDRITLVIGGAAWGSTYQVGDTLELPIIAAAPLFLTGGQDGDPTQTWYVSGSVDGAFPSYLLGVGSPVSYDEDGLQFSLTPGGAPFEVGDKFQFSIVGGHFRWRPIVGGVAGAWSGSLDITSAPIALDDGLSLEFSQGVDPSLVAGDNFQFRALQPWAATNMLNPDRARWQWGDEATPNAVFDCGSPHAIVAIGLAEHTLPSDASLVLEGGDVAGVYTWSETIPLQAGAVFHLLSQPRSNRYYRCSLADAADAGIGFLWAGDPWQPDYSAEVQLRRDYKLERDSSGGAGSGWHLPGQSDLSECRVDGRRDVGARQRQHQRLPGLAEVER
jgi:hypothetical protein